MSLENELMRIERQLWTNDAAIYAANLTDDTVLVFAETGVIRRREALAAIRQENAESRRWAETHFEDVVTLSLTPDVALLNYRVTARWEHERESRVALASSVYVRRDRLWRLAFHQQTPV
jgi:uncharacterized protein (TIGR02246 family)